jgi:REP element-mobilizing transposase RayT
MASDIYNKEPLVRGNYYHIYNRCNNGIDIFYDAGNYEHFLKLYQQYIHPIAETFAWCFMKNHFHFLVYVRLENEILRENLEYSTVEHPKIVDASKQFGHLFNAYTQAINKRYNRTGSLFEKPFERKRVTSEKYLKNLVHYIHNNPVHHGFCNHAWEYPWSSYGTILSDKPTKLKRDEVIKMYGDRENFISYHDSKHDFDAISEFIIE